MEEIYIEGTFKHIEGSGYLNRSVLKLDDVELSEVLKQQKIEEYEKHNANRENKLFDLNKVFRNRKVRLVLV